MVDWTSFVQYALIIWAVALLLFKGGRKILLDAADSVSKAITSKRFIVLMIATWFVYRKLTIDPNWLMLAGFYISVDTLQNHEVFSALATWIKSPKIPKTPTT